MDVALCAPYGLAQVSGISVFLTDFATRLRALGHRAITFTPDRTPWLAGVPTGLRDLALSGWTFLAIVRSRPWTAIHANQPHLQSCAALLAARILGARIIVTYHSPMPLAHRASAGIIQAASERILSRGADARTFVSEATRSGFPGTNGRVVRLGVDVAAIDQIRAETPRPPGRPYTFLFSGRQTKSKGFFDVLAAAERLLNSRAAKAFQLWLTGEVPSEEAHEKAALLARLNKVVVDHGTVTDRPDLLRLLAQTDAIVLPSYREGIPLVVAEAMGLGCVPIVSAVGGIPELVRDQATGYIVPPGDVDALAAAMERCILAREEGAAIARRAREEVLTSFSLDNTVRTFLSLYQKDAR